MIRDNIMKKCSINKRRCISFAISMCMVITMIPQAVFAETEGATMTLTSDDLRTVVANAEDGDVIDLGGKEVTIEEEGESNASPWIINKKVTIQNGIICLRTGGIILGADVTFSNIEFGFINRVRNAIIANGHTLTLVNTAADDSALPYHLFCGGVSGLTDMPSSGTKGTINVSGKVEIGNIYAGAISSDGNAAVSAIPAEINVNVDTGSSIGVEYNNTQKGIYSSGAVEFPVDENEMLNPDYVVGTPTPSTGHSVTGDVSITVNSGIVENVNGATGSANNACVTFKSSNQNLQTVNITDAGVLTVEAGKLVLGTDSDLVSTDVCVKGNGRLGFDEMTEPQINSLVGADTGTIVIGKEQTLTVRTEATGKTKVSIGEYNLDESELPLDGHAYIVTESSADNAFELWPIKAGNGVFALVNNNGTWSARNTATGPVISSIAISNGTTTNDMEGNYIALPVTAGYVPDDGWLSDISATVKVNGSELSASNPLGYGYSYENSEFCLFFTKDESDKNLFIFTVPDDTTQTFAVGTFNIDVIIPASNMADNKAQTVSFVVNVVESRNEYTVNVTAKPAEGGTVSGGGTYRENESATVTATANNGYKFVQWLKGGVQVSTNASYTIDVTENLALVAEFEKESSSTPTPQPCTHSYTKQDVKQAALKSPATCTTAAAYYKSCDKCGEVSKSDSETFTYGSPTGHKYGAYVTSQKAGFSTKGTQDATCSICKAHKLIRSIPAVSTPALSAKTYTFNNKVKKPSVAVKNAAGKTVTFSTSYASGRKNVGKYAVKVTLTGADYAGTKTVYFKINPKGVKVSKLSKAKKSFTVKWKKPSATYRNQTTGYQIRYSTSSKMTKAKTVTVKGTKATAKKIKKLKSKKKYYVQIRTYKTVKGAKYYSSWSAKKSVKTK